MTDESEAGRGGDPEDPKGGIPPITKKILSLGLGAFFLGEDYIRRAVKEAKLPRDIGKSIAQNATKGKDELFGYVARELSGFLRQMDIQTELSTFASKHKIKLTTEIEFIPHEKPEAKPEDPASASTDETRPLPVDDPSVKDESSFDRDASRFMED
ncbi:MAG: hypothetical protein ACAI25_07345 [Planctomycetota bacterium]